MKIDDALISRLETLSRLSLSDAEKQTLQKDLNDILLMVDKLDEIDTQGVAPLVYISEVVNNLRADEIAGEVSTADALRNAPDTDGIYFRVPKVIPISTAE